PLTLTRSGVGLAAAAAASGCTSPSSATIGGSIVGSLVGASTCSLSSSDQVASETPVLEKRESTLARAIGPKGSGIIAGYRSCSANMHTHIPPTASAVPGHFLIFSYELLIDVTLSSLTRGTHRVSTRTPLGSSTGAATPNGATGGFAMSQRHPHTAAPAPCHRVLSSLQTGDGAGVPSGPHTAAAVYFPHNQQQPSGGSMLDGREKAQIKGGSRFSVGAFQPADTSSSADHRSSVRYSAMQTAPIHRGTTQPGEDDENVLPNAVDLMRFKYDTSVVVVPKIFVPAAAIPEADSAQASVAEEAGTDTTNGKNAVADGVPASSLATPQMLANASRVSSPATPQLLLATASLVSSPATAPAATPAMAEDDPSQIAEDGSPRPPRQVHAAASECDLARAVYAAAEKVLNDKEWDRPNSIYLSAAPLLDKKATRRRKKQMALVQTSGFEDSDGTNVSPLMRSIERSRSASTSETEATEEEGEEEEEEEDLDVQRAINRLAPQSRSSSLNGGVNAIISGIDFFGAGADAGPELTGLLSADPDKLVFGAMPLLVASDDLPSKGPSQPEEQANAVPSSSATAYSPAVSREDSSAPSRPDEPQPQPQPQQQGKKQSPAAPTAALPLPPQIQRINSALRRSISMPGRGPSLSAVAVAASAAAAHADSPESTANMQSPGSTVARSAFETSGTLSGKVLIRKNFLSRVGRSNSTALDGTAAHIVGLSPRSMVSAVSSTGPLGANSRAGVFRSLSHRFTSWFKK
ncbi:hypothetical protein EV175_003139, partial [Coemansia sp. RSA 1933]